MSAPYHQRTFAQRLELIARDIYPEHIVRFWPREDGPTDGDDRDTLTQREPTPTPAPTPARADDRHAFDEAA
jgi:hypothetical protein